MNFFFNFYPNSWYHCSVHILRLPVSDCCCHHGDSQLFYRKILRNTQRKVQYPLEVLTLTEVVDVPRLVPPKLSTTRNQWSSIIDATWVWRTSQYRTREMTEKKLGRTQMGSLGFSHRLTFRIFYQGDCLIWSISVNAICWYGNSCGELYEYSRWYNTSGHRGTEELFSIQIPRTDYPVISRDVFANMRETSLEGDN